MVYFHKNWIVISVLFIFGLVRPMGNDVPYHPKAPPPAATDCRTTVGSSAEFRWSSDLAAVTTPLTPQIDYDQNTGTVNLLGDVPTISPHNDNPCGPQSTGVSHHPNPTYIYRAIVLDDPSQTQLLQDQEMKKMHALYLEGSDGSMQRLELEKNCLYRELHRHDSIGDYVRFVDPTRPANLRRLSFMNRVLKHYNEQKEVNRPPSPGTIQTVPRPGQTPREFSDNVALLRPAPSIARALDQARLLPVTPHMAQVSQDFDGLDTPQSDSALSSEFRRKVTANPRTDFKTFMQQTNELLDDLEAHGAITGQTALFFAKEFAEGTAEYVAYIKDNPKEWASDVVKGNLEMMKQLAIFFMDSYSAPDELYVSGQEMAFMEQRVQERMESATQLYSQVRGTLSQMNRHDWAKLSSRICVDYCAFKAIDLGVSGIRNAKLPARVAANPLFEQLEHQLGSFGKRHPELVTTDGFVFKMPQAMEEEASILKTAADKVKGSTQEVAKDVARVESVANMKKVFEKNDFGRALKKASVKTKFQCRKTGAQVYKVTEKIPEYGLKKGDQLCLDTLHLDHIEVYNKGDDVITVLNLDGSVNSDKQAKVLRQARVLHKK